MISHEEEASLIDPIRPQPPSPDHVPASDATPDAVPARPPRRSPLRLLRKKPPAATRPKDRATRLSRLAYGVLTLLAILLLGMEARHEWNLRHTRMQQASVAASNLARSLLKDVENYFAMADTALVGMVEQVETEGTGAASIAQAGRLMRRHLAHQPDVRNYTIHDRDGLLLLTSHPQGSTSVSIADRDYFRRLRGRGAGVLEVGAPVRSQLDGAWVITLSRAFVDASGSFAGVAVASIEVKSLVTAFSGYDLGRDGSVGLVRSDGRLLARLPAQDAHLGNLVLNRTPLRDPVAEGGSGFFQTSSPIDDVERLGAFLSSSRYPLTLTVGYGVDETLSDWRETALTRASAVVVLVGLLMLLGHHLIRQAGRRLAAEQVLAESEAHFRLLAEQASPMVARIGTDHCIRYASPAAARLLDLPSEALPGSLFEDLADPEDRDALHAALLQAGTTEADVEVRWRATRPGGRLCWIETTLRRTDEAAEEGYIAVSRDITERQALEQRMAALAATDGLTGLANRRRFDELLEVEWRRAARESRWLAVLLLDVDRFKLFNDRYGHLAGDDALREVTRAMDRAIRRPGDLAARYGGEEFVAILPNTDPAGAREVGERVRQAVAALGIVHAGSETGMVTASIGVAALQPLTGVPPDPAMLLGAADSALYAAKRLGRNRVVEAAAITVMPTRRAG